MSNEFKSIQIENETSKLSLYKFIETPNIDKLATLIYNPQFFQDMNHIRTSPATKEIYSTEEQWINEYFNKINKRSKNRHIKVEYRHSQRGSVGRVNPVKSLSLCSIRRQIRHTIAQDVYYDFDMKNAHFYILKHFCDVYNIPSDNISYYVNNREQVLKEVQEHYGCSRDTAKNLFIRLAYGGGLSNWLCDNELSGAQTTPHIVDGIIQDFKPIASFIYNENPLIREMIKTDEEIYKREIKLYEEGKLIYTSGELRGQPRPKPKKPYMEGKAMSIFAQHKERIIIETVLEYFIQNKIVKKDRAGNINAVYCFDGIMVPKENVKKETSIVCAELTVFIKSKLGIEIPFEEKPMSETLNLSGVEMITYDDYFNKLKQIEKSKIERDRRERVGVGGDENDIEIMGRKHTVEYLLGGVRHEEDACIKVLKIYPYFNTCNDELYVYDNETGVWSCNSNIVNKVLRWLGEYLFVEVYDTKEKEWITSSSKSYGYNTNLRNTLKEALRSATIDDNFINKMENTSLYKIAFQNGWLDFTTNTFHNEFTPDIMFHKKLPYDFEEDWVNQDDNEQYMNEMIQKIFYDALGKENGDYFLYCLSRGVIGAIEDKLFLFCVGDKGNNGKGVITDAILSMLGSGIYGNIFNGDNLLYNKREEAQELRWKLLTRYSRVVMSNEMKINEYTAINSNIVKKLSSGGDTLEARVMRGNEERFISHSLCMCFVNDLPPFKPINDSLKSRCRIFQFPNVFKDNPTNENEKKADRTIKQQISSERFKKALFHKVYAIHREYFNKSYDVPSAIMDYTNDNLDVPTFESVMNENFVITNDKRDKISNTIISQTLKVYNLFQSSQKINMNVREWANAWCRKNNIEMNKSNVKKGSIRLENKVKQGWTGIREKYDDDAEETPETLETAGASPRVDESPDEEEYMEDETDIDLTAPPANVKLQNYDDMYDSDEWC